MGISTLADSRTQDNEQLIASSSSMLSHVKLLPTETSITTIKGVRKASASQYITYSSASIPINTGHEQDPLVIDFQSPLFSGSLLLRLRGNQPGGYFGDKRRQFQVVVSGRFLQSIPMNRCFTGQVFERPIQLPARRLVQGVVHAFTTLAPQLQVDLSGENPYAVTPLVATANTVLVGDAGKNLGRHLEEPTTSSSMSILDAIEVKSKENASSLQRQQFRKRVFNKLAAANPDSGPCFDTEKTYTFEFYQHLLVFSDPKEVKLCVGGMNLGVSSVLNGQAIKIMAGYGSPNNIQTLWSFDLIHGTNV